ncbi:MAG: YhjD/YihY/BrkB family envelope integrity protein [Gallintestinimicrobium sp.]
MTTLQKSDLLKAVSEVMPSPIVPMMSSLIESLYNSTVGVTSVAAIVTVWSASKGMLSIMRGLNAMNGVVEDRNYFVQRILASFYTILLLIVLLFSFSWYLEQRWTSFKRQDPDTGSSDVHSDAF